jgi:hypothetical protein
VLRLFSHINYLAVFSSAMIFFFIGGLWYIILFPKTWLDALNFDESQQKKAEKGILITLIIYFVNGLILSFIMTNLLWAMQTFNFWDGVQNALLIWLGFVFTIALNTFLFEKRPWKLFLINISNYLVAFSLMGGILAAWRL